MPNRHWITGLRPSRVAIAVMTGLLTAPIALSAATATPVGAANGGYPYASEPCEHYPYQISGTGYWCANYDWGPKHTQKYNDPSEISPYGYTYRNCTDFVAWKVASLGVPAGQYRGLGEAKDWASPPAANKLTVNTTPAVGAASVDTTGKFGHVAYISAYNGSTGVITVEEYNEDENGIYGTRTGTLPDLGFSKVVHFEKFESSSPSGTLWGINANGQAMRYAGNAKWTWQGGPAFKDIAASSDGSTVAAVSTSGAVYTYTGNGTWHMVSGQKLTDVADQAGTLWGINANGQAMRYAGNAKWTWQGGPAFKDIAASSDGSTVAAVSTSGAVYTYTGNGTWHMVSGQKLTDVADQAGTLWGINANGQAMRYAGNAKWTWQGGPAFKDIAASKSRVAAVSTSGAVYTYTGSGTWHMVSGQKLTDVAIQ